MKYELVRLPCTISSVMPSSAKRKCRFGSPNGELITGFSMTTCFTTSARPGKISPAERTCTKKRSVPCDGMLRVRGSLFPGGGSVLRENPVKEQVNDHPRHGHVHPDRPGPAGDLLVQLEAPLHRPAQCHQRERNNRERKRKMGKQD